MLRALNDVIAISGFNSCMHRSFRISDEAILTDYHRCYAAALCNEIENSREQLPKDVKIYLISAILGVVALELVR